MRSARLDSRVFLFSESAAMSSPVETVRKLWLVATGRSERPPEVVIHDPSHRRPHDLDDPFFDDSVQIRMGEKIAAVGNRKTKNGY